MPAWATRSGRSAGAEDPCPQCMVATEGGALGPRPKRLILGIGDSACSENAMTVMPLWRLFADQQNGFVDVGMVGGAQVDRYGNLNSTAIFGDGNYFAPGLSASRQRRRQRYRQLCGPHCHFHSFAAAALSGTGRLHHLSRLSYWRRQPGNAPACQEAVRRQSLRTNASSGSIRKRGS